MIHKCTFYCNGVFFIKTPAIPPKTKYFFGNSMLRQIILQGKYLNPTTKGLGKHFACRLSSHVNLTVIGNACCIIIYDRKHFEMWNSVLTI